MAFLAACGGSSTKNPGPLSVTLGELLDAHRRDPKADKYRGLVVRLAISVTDVNHVSHTVSKCLRPDCLPIVVVYFGLDQELPKPGPVVIVAKVLSVDTTKGDRGVSDLTFTMILTDGRVQPSE